MPFFNTKIYLGAPDAEVIREHPERIYVQDSSDYMDELFTPDVEIHENDVIRFGNTEVLFKLVPGHTPGVISCFFDVTDGKVDLLNKRQFMIDHPDAPNPFISETAWKEYLQMKYDTLKELMADPAQN